MKNQPNILLLCVLLFLFSNFDLFAQDKEKAFFTIETEVSKPLKITLEDLLKMEQHEVETKNMDGQSNIYKGVLLSDILGLAGVPLGKELKGENMAKYLLIEAKDGYKVVFSLPEIAPEFTDQIFILAYEADGKPISDGVGPFQLIVHHEKKRARWVKEITNMKVVISKD